MAARNNLPDKIGFPHSQHKFFHVHWIHGIAIHLANRESKFLAVYGNTKKAVEILAKELEDLGCPKVAVNDLAREDMAECVEDAFRYGKIVLATRYEDVLGVGDELSGLHFYWAEQAEKEVVDMPYALSMMNSGESLWVQDRFKYSIQNKFDAFKEGLENCQASDDSIFINFLSLSGQGLIPHPKGNADSLNRMFNETKLQGDTSYGIIVVDRANKDMASKIFETNF